jgi:hypothetical protein
MYYIILFVGITLEALVYGDAEGGENDEKVYKTLVFQLCLPWGPGKVGNVISLYQFYIVQPSMLEP